MVIGGEEDAEGAFVGATVVVIVIVAVGIVVVVRFVVIFLVVFHTFIVGIVYVVVVICVFVMITVMLGFVVIDFGAAGCSSSGSSHFELFGGTGLVMQALFNDSLCVEAGLMGKGV